MYLVTAKEMQELDREHIERLGLPGVVLMEHAGAVVAEEVQRRFPQPCTAVVLCGTGNNGGDGWVVARKLLFAGWKVYAWLIGKPEKVRGDAKVFYELFRRLGEICIYEENRHDQLQAHLQNADVIIDAMLGTGGKGSLRTPLRSVVHQINRFSDKFVVAVDLPTGVDADTGRVEDEAVRADLTVTFVYPKWGHFLLPGAKFTGELAVKDIGFAPEKWLWNKPNTRLNHPRWWKEAIRERDPWGHKGTYGHLLVIGGAKGMLGAIKMAGKAAYRAGAGYVTLTVPQGQAIALSSSTMQELTWYWPGEDHFTPDSARKFDERQERFSAIAVGPGLGRFPEDWKWLASLLELVKVPIVLDADALNILAEDLTLLSRCCSPVVLTPHPGEMARLCQCSTRDVEENRAEIAKQFSQKWNVTVVLKGRFTIIAFPDGTQYLNQTGNSSLAKAGSGDLLTGIIGALLAQRLPVEQAVPMAVYLHGRAGELASESRSKHSVVAEQILSALDQAYYQLLSERALF